MKRFIIGFLLVVFLTVFALAEGSGEKTEGVKIEVISMGFQHEYWQTVKLGVDKAAKELGINVPFFGPTVETEVDVQINLFENSLAKNVDAILLAPCDSEALSSLAEKAVDKGVVVATFDVDISAPEYRISFVATDNYAAGKLAGDQMGKLLGGKGKVGIVGHIAATFDTRERIGGFIDIIKQKYPEITLLDVVYGDGDHKKSMDKAADMITSNPDLRAIYATNEGGAIGVALAVEEADKVGEVKVVGFDSSDQEIDYLMKGVINGFVVQNPFQMGYLGVKMLYDKVVNNIEPVERIDTGVVWVDMQNYNNPEIQKILYPLK